LTQLNPTVSPVVHLTDILTSARVKVPLESSTKAEVLHELVALLTSDGASGDAEEVLRVVEQREQVLSTGIGHGVALPHGKSSACPELTIAAGVTREPLDFDALDGEPVRLVFLLVGPESAAGEHIKALSRISRLVRQPELRERLIGSADPASFMQALHEAEAEGV